MGLLDDAVPGGNIAKPLIIALGALLVGKMLGGRSTEPEATTPPIGTNPVDVNPGGTAQDGGLLGGLGGLLEKLGQAGHADKTDTWLGPGENAPIQPGQLGTALGQTTISDLAKQAGVSEQELLAQLSSVLPGIVDKLTPNGRVPTNTEIASLLQR